MKLSGETILPFSSFIRSSSSKCVPGIGALQRLDRHAEQLEARLLERVVDARRPLHLAAAAHQVDVVLLEAVDAVAPRLLRRLAGAVGGRQQRRHVLGLARERHDADAAAEPEGALLPDELVVADRVAELLGHPHGLVERAALEQHRVLVATQPGERVAPADLGLEQRPDLAQERVTRAVAAGVVDDLELVDVDVGRARRRSRAPGRCAATARAWPRTRAG